MGRQINKDHKAIDVTKPWKTRLSPCKDIDPATLTIPFNRTDFMRQPRHPKLKFPGEKNVNSNKRETS